jgi:hypothetical protein
MIAWLSRKKTYVALISIEAGYMLASRDIHEAICLHKLITKLFDQELDHTLIYCDN